MLHLVTSFVTPETSRVSIKGLYREGLLTLIRSLVKLNLMAYTCNPSILDLEEKEQEFEAALAP